MLVYEAVEVLVEEEEAGADEGRVREVQLALGHVRYHQFVGDLGDDHAEGEQVQTGVVLKQVAGRLLEDDEGQGEDESDVQTGTQHAGVSHGGAVFADASVQNDVEVVVAGVEGPADDAQDGEDVEL